MGTGEFRRIHSRVSWMFRPVERSDVGVDLDEEPASDGHGLGLGMVDVGGKNRPAASDLVAHELRRDALADRDELHLAGDLALLRIVHQGHRAPPAQDLPRPREGESEGRHVGTPGRHRVVRSALQDPGTAELRQAGFEIDGDGRIRIRPRRVVDAEWRIHFGLAPQAARGREADLAEGDTHPARTGNVDLVRSGKGRTVQRRCGRERLATQAHVSSLRRHYPHQVRGVSDAM